MTVRNRVWDAQAGPGFVVWETDFPDTLGVQYTGPGTFGVDTSDLCVSGGKAAVEGPETLLDQTFDPVALHPLDGSLPDVVGGGATTFSIVGTEQYTTGPVPGTQAALYNGSSRADATNNNATYRLTGDLTAQMLVRYGSAPPSAVEVMVACDGVGATLATNSLWYLGVTNVSLSAHGYESPTNIFNAPAFSDAVITDGNWHHVVMTRDVSGGDNNVVVQVWIDGIMVGEITNGRLPVGGTSGVLHLGGNGFGTDNAPANSEMSSVKLIDRVLTQAEIIAEYKRWIPEAQR